MPVSNSVNRPYVLSIAGFDPSGGAGILADIKAFETCHAYGMGVVSALTVQNDIAFNKVEWLPFSQIIEQIDVLQKRFSFDYIKIGLIQNLEVLHQVILHIKKNVRFSAPTPKFIWDPILKASAGFNFHQPFDRQLLEEIAQLIYLITPNTTEAFELGIHKNAQENAAYLSTFCNVYLKGGHDEQRSGKDLLYLKNQTQPLVYENTQAHITEKHGSGCVLASAITSFLAHGDSLEEACKKAKQYIMQFLSSNKSLLGFHNNPRNI